MADVVPFYSLVPQHRLIKAEVMKAIEDVYEQNKFILGDALSDFESRFADFAQSKHCIGVANGTDAIELALRALGIGPGDEVIVPSHTFIATWLAVTAVGAVPVPVEPDTRTFNIDGNNVEGAITKKTKAIIPVHLYGLCCDMDGIMRIADKHKIFVVEDNAQSQGASYDRRAAGCFGQCAATSFYPVKNLGALGDGGAITTSSDELASKLRELRNYGAINRSHYRSPGTNSRLDELQAAVLRVKLKYLPQWNSERASIAARYLSDLKGVGDIILPETSDKSTHVYHLFVIRSRRRDELASFLKTKGVETMVHYPMPPHLQPVFSSLGFREGSFPIAEDIANTCLSLPLWPGITSAQLDHVIKSVRGFY